MSVSPGSIQAKKPPLLWSALIFLFSYLLSGCIPEPLEVENVPAIEQKIVVNTQLVTNDHLLVWLTKSFGALDASESSAPEALIKAISLNDATVIVNGPDGSETLIAVEYGLYGGIFIPFKKGYNYDLTIHSESLGDVKASTVVKDQVKFNWVEVSSYYDFYDKIHAEVTVSFTDPEEKNWYLINAQKVRTRIEDFRRNAINPDSFTLLLEDEEFNGKEVIREFEFPVEDYNPGDSIAITLSNISQEYYDFMKMRNDKGAGFLDFLSEPANYPTNVRGGKGFFNLYMPDIKVMILEEE